MTIVKLKKIKVINDRVQKAHSHGGVIWNQCETIDDEIHECLTLLND